MPGPLSSLKFGYVYFFRLSLTLRRPNDRAVPALTDLAQTVMVGQITPKT